MRDEFELINRIKAEIYSYDGKMSVWLNDFHSSPLELDAHRTFEAASCIKSFVLGALFYMCEHGERSLSDKLSLAPRHVIDGSGVIKALCEPLEITVQNVATLMIIVSDNIAANMIIEYLGVDTINEWIRGAGFENTVLHNPIDFEKYPKLGTTTPADYGRLFSQLCEGTLVSESASAAMLDIFKKQHYNTMLTSLLPAYYLDSEDTGDEELVWTASKSGSMNACRNDGGIVCTPFGKYVIVIMTSDFSDSLYHSEHPSTVFGARVSRLVFERFVNNNGRF